MKSKILKAAIAALPFLGQQLQPKNKQELDVELAETLATGKGKIRQSSPLPGKGKPRRQAATGPGSYAEHDRIRREKLMRGN